jgi:hypothetical protein
MLVMDLLDQIVVRSKFGERYIQLYQGDLANMPADQAVDVLIVSAFPNHYIPARGSLIGALYSKGVSVQELSTQKAADLRANFSCWLSNDITMPADLGFRKILCFEPLVKGRPTEVIGDIFLSLTPFVMADKSIHQIAMPLVATGLQGVPVTQILEPLLDAAVHWLELGLPVTHLKIVEYSEAKAVELSTIFAELKQRYIEPVVTLKHQFKYDLFISYSHENTDEVLMMLEALQQLRPSLRIFLDRSELNNGSAWQQEIYEALDNCQKVIAVYSPTYLSSKVCQQEFNIAMFRHRESNNQTLIPVYLHLADLPTYMKLIQFVECREGGRERIQAACQAIVAQL